MEIRLTNLEPNRIYHIFNRGINGCETYRTKENYFFFLRKTQLFLSPYFEIYAYCLMKNHFHFLLMPKPLIHADDAFKFEEGLHSKQGFHSNQLGKLISSYTQAFNKVFKRHGPLFESPFKRIEVKTEAHLFRALIYIHNNSRVIGIHPSKYAYCSYSEIIDEQQKIANKSSLKWFGGKDNFIFCHNKKQ